MVLLLAVIYLTFISLGLPDSIFGAAWPVMHVDLNVNESFASIYMIITAVCSGGVSFFAGPLIRKFGTGNVTVISVLLTVSGLLIISFANHIAVAIVGSVLLGYGAGAIDTGLNNFVSTHYKASQMNWLHCFWGIGVTVSPLIMSVFLGDNGDWQGGYRMVAYIQAGIFGVLLLSIPLWRKYDKKELKIPPVADVSSTIESTIPSVGEDASLSGDETDTNVPTASAEKPTKKKKKSAFVRALKTRGVPFAILSLGLYCGMEFLLGTWGATYIVNVKYFTPALAARWISIYYGGIMLGRLLSGFLSYKLNDKNLIRLGEAVALVGMLLFALPIGTASLVGLIVIGIGFGPIFPSTLHATPSRFGEELSADITGFQMGGGYAIAWAVQLTFGFVAPATTFAFMPYLLLVLCAALFAITELVNKLTAKA